MFFLKIKDFAHGTPKWWYFGNIDHFQLFDTSKIKYDSKGKPSFKFCADTIIIIPKDDRKRGEVEYRKICCTKSDGSELDIVFSTFAYLCNDEGKTIERINVYETVEAKVYKLIE